MKICSYALITLISFLLPLLNNDLIAQCTSLISTFPYEEDFEVSSGNWTAGGNASDWAWGTPQKSIIKNAGSGNKCWITGGLTGSSYNNNEEAWLQSPCFDISSLQHPYISFKVFWETESGYDGATLQYSTDSGLSWENLGNRNDAQNCLNGYWFNTADIRYLGVFDDEGWSGSVADGYGSKGWVTANHTLPFLQGVTSVMFRFFFGAGSINNTYDGFAVDDFILGEASPNNADFNFTCSSANQYQFIDNSTPCPTIFQWHFDDINSGSNNTSTQKNPLHTFTTAGTHNVSLTVYGPDNQPSAIIKKIISIAASTLLVKPIYCNGNNNASATVVINAIGNYTYLWSTTPPQTTATAINLSAGSYTVQINGDGVCPATDSITITEPQPLSVTATVTDATCASSNGDAILQASGGTAPYNFLWLNDRLQSNIHNSLAKGNYSVQLTDANNCLLDTNVTIYSKNNLVISLGKDTGICQGSSVLLTVGNFTKYLWQDGSVLPTYFVQHEGLYYVTVTDDNGCIASDTINIYKDCGGIVFPTAFTPNNDGLNDAFGPIGNLSLITDYSLHIYNRWGNLLFFSSDPNRKWDGNLFKQHDASQTFTWFAAFKYKDQSTFKKGTITVLY